MPKLNLDQAQVVVAAALAKGSELGLKPLCVAVLDPGGHLVALARQDGASTLRPQIAVGKAASALGLGISSRKIADMAAERPTFVANLAALAPQGLVPAAGGVIASDGSEIVGAIGVTGDTSDNDEVCALAGLAAVALSQLA
ncbi:MAG: heme-binding protein [Novosphingobium sp.]|nr:heme-binding protein [Novosphingobium sp.]